MPDQENTAPLSEISIADAEVSLDQLIAVALEGHRVNLSDDPNWIARLKSGRMVLEQSLSAGDRIYGVSTGVGCSSDRTVGPRHSQDFAYQIIRQHGCGTGEPFSETEGRAIVFARLVSLSKGYSAVRLSLLEALASLLNHDVIPVIPSLGSVGASGDLTPLSYLAAVLAGEREVYYGGEVLPAARALRKAGLPVHTFVPKESLAIMNGTAVMTAVGVLTAERFDRTLAVCERASALAAEILFGRSQAFHPTAHRLKHHPGQMAAAAAIRAALADSRLIDSRSDAGRLVQDPYSIRCAAHVIGAARDALTWTRQVLQRELNSVNDNPIVDPEEGETIFAGNFYGGHIALTMDLIKSAAASVADLIDRQYALLVDARHNCGLPETLVAYEGCGLKALQLTCSALTARAIQRSAPDSVLSRPTEGGNQDKVSMGLNAALNAAEVTTLLQQVLATQLIALSNAAGLREENQLAPAGREFLDRIRAVSTVLAHDRRLDGDLQGLTVMIDQGMRPKAATRIADGAAAPDSTTGD
ncbi:MAG: aromatic amino acid lyase [Desulfosarcina sp.]|nr:aromatic amino acid lyase [Desulfobacterales bacterium]